MRSIEWRNFRWPWVTPNHPISVTSWPCAKTAEQTVCAGGNSGISKIKGIFLKTFHPNSGRKFRNCTSIVSGAVSLDALSMWSAGDGRRSPVCHTDRQHLCTARWAWGTASRGSVSGSRDVYREKYERKVPVIIRNLLSCDDCLEVRMEKWWELCCVLQLCPMISHTYEQFLNLVLV